MDALLIPAVSVTVGIAGTRLTARQIGAIRAQVERNARLPARPGWEQKACEQARVIALVAAGDGDPGLAAVLGQGAALAFDLMLAAGPAADGIAANFHLRLLEQLSLGDADGVADETERHLRCLHFMWRLSGPRPAG